jgi:hypothetical protein
MGQLRNVIPQNDSQGEHKFRIVKDLKVVPRKGKGGGSKKSKKVGKNVENNANETLGLFKKISIF